MTDGSEHRRRFGGIARLYGDRALRRFSRSHCCVAGVGGVGSWVVEALARSGIGELTLIDMDHVAESNINRQLPAVTETIGKAKVLALAERVAQINANCVVHTFEDFISADEAGKYITGDMDFVFDCIDSFRIKAALIAWCKCNKIPVITVGGAGGKLDPLNIRLADLSRTDQDPLLAKTRKELRQKYHFPRNLKRRFDVPAVFSQENIIQPQSTEMRSSPDERVSASHLNCAGLGSVTHVTATFGYVAVSKVLMRLAQSGVRNSVAKATK